MHPVLRLSGGRVHPATAELTSQVQVLVLSQGKQGIEWRGQYNNIEYCGGVLRPWQSRNHSSHQTLTG